LGQITDGTSQTLGIGERPAVYDLEYGWWACGAGFGNTGEGDCLLSTRLGISPGVDSSAHLTHFWSWHPEGCNFALMDGSVRFLFYRINRITLNRLATKSAGDVPGDF
jgi:prepilin-type processing-associated H-X9-DG protein